jgi:hypothetical protein
MRSKNLKKILNKIALKYLVLIIVIIKDIAKKEYLFARINSLEISVK